MGGCGSGGSGNATGFPDEQWPAQLTASPHAVQQLLPVPTLGREQKLVVRWQVSVVADRQPRFVTVSFG